MTIFMRAFKSGFHVGTIRWSARIFVRKTRECIRKRSECLTLCKFIKWLDWSVPSLACPQSVVYNFWQCFSSPKRKAQKLRFVLVANFEIHPMNFTVSGFIIHRKTHMRSNNTGVFLCWCLTPSYQTFLFCVLRFFGIH